MIRLLLAIGLAAALATATQAAEREFPSLHARLLRDGSAVDLTDALRGGKHILVVSFYADQRFKAERWLPVLRRKAAGRAVVHHVVFSQDAGVLKRFVYTAYLRSISVRGPDDFVVFGDRNRFMRQTGITDDGVAEIFLLDDDARIALRIAGPLSDSAIERIAAALEPASRRANPEREQRDQR
jgi:hypothetical protein